MHVNELFFKKGVKLKTHQVNFDEFKLKYFHKVTPPPRLRLMISGLTRMN